MKAIITLNQEHNGIEIKFPEKPSRDTLDALKALGFRWHRQKALWYAKQTAERMEQIENLISGAPAAPKAKANKYGVKVGDLFVCSWGWEQTNVNFFQVIELVGTASVRIREVHPEVLEETAVSGMSCNRKYRIPEDGEMLPAASHASFVEDQEHGDLHRVTNKFGYPSFKVGKSGCYQDTATKYTGGFEYVSWYA